MLGNKLYPRLNTEVKARQLPGHLNRCGFNRTTVLIQ